MDRAAEGAIVLVVYYVMQLTINALDGLSLAMTIVLPYNTNSLDNGRYERWLVGA